MQIASKLEGISKNCAFKALTTETFIYPLAAVSLEREHLFHLVNKTLIQRAFPKETPSVSLSSCSRKSFVKLYTSYAREILSLQDPSQKE